MSDIFKSADYARAAMERKERSKIGFKTRYGIVYPFKNEKNETIFGRTPGGGFYYCPYIPKFDPEVTKRITEQGQKILQEIIEND